MRPRDAAALVLVDRDSARVLMGRRAAVHRFMPGKWVFPGGRVARQDYGAPCASELDAAVMWRLAAQVGERRARALALAAIRETFEETGLSLSLPTASHGEAPDLGRLVFIARLITPPHRPYRYDTCFFLAEAADLERDRSAESGELEDVAWMPIADIAMLETALPTRIVLDEARAHLADSARTPLFHRFRTNRH